MASLKTLANRMERLNRQLPRQVNEIARDVATVVLHTIIRETPVDTSLAISNWQVGLGEANMSNIPTNFPGIGGSTRSQAYAETLAVGRVYIAGKRPGMELHISNGLEYIQKIDNVSSSPGFKDAALRAGREELEKAKIKL